MSTIDWAHARLIMPLHHFAALTVINFLSFAIDCPDKFLSLGLAPYMKRFRTPNALNILSAGCGRGRGTVASASSGEARC
ncbi:hypothetical protein GAY30_09875 [Azospirillum brasilense]|nr:hypothetical protein [Azospirillum brasilense]NUB32912.1 hypothetical protein [Azospirillum brasilense]RIW02321.1 hypothetical protein D2T81_16040 [Azospirillum brasilense]